MQLRSTIIMSKSLFDILYQPLVVFAIIVSVSLMHAILPYMYVCIFTNDMSHYVGVISCCVSCFTDVSPIFWDVVIIDKINSTLFLLQFACAQSAGVKSTGLSG